MARQSLNVGAVANDGTGDDLRSAFQKVEANFIEIYANTAVGSQIQIAGNEITSTQSNANLKLTASGTGIIELEGLSFSDNNISATRSNDDLVLNASGTGKVKISGLKYPTADGSANQFLLTDGAGNLSFGAPTGYTFVGDDSTGTAVPLGETFKFVGGTNVTTAVSGDQVTINAVLTTSVFTEMDAGNIRIEGNDILNTATDQHLDLKTTSKGNVRIQSGVGLDYATKTAGSTAALTIDQFTMATYRSANYTVQVTDATRSEYQTSLLNVVHDGTSAYFQEFGVTFTGSSQLATITADVSGSTVRIRATPNAIAPLDFKTFRTAIIV